MKDFEDNISSSQTYCAQNNKEDLGANEESVLTLHRILCTKFPKW